MTAFALLFTMAAIGIAETAYLIRTRKASERPVCPIGGGCVTVLTSKYNSLFGVHNDLLGLAFYLAMSVFTAFLVLGIGPVAYVLLAVQIMVDGAVLMSLALIYLQWKVIKAWCFWCLMSAATIFVMAIILLTL